MFLSIRFMFLFLLGTLFLSPFSYGEEPKKVTGMSSDSLQKQLQETIKDRTLSLSPKEIALQFQILKKQAEERESTDTLNIEKPEIFQKLMKFPEKNRGKLFQIKGEIRHVTKLSVDKNKWGITSLFQIVFYPSYSERLPLLLVCTSLPKGVVEGENLFWEGTVVGLFFKILLLPEGRKSSAAPLLLLESISPQQNTNLAMGLSSEHFAAVNHKSKKMGAAESDLYYRVLQLAQTVPHKKQVAAARQFEKICRAKRSRYRNKPKLSFATYYDLFTHYKEYEGKPVTLKGVVREHKQYPAGKNDYGITTLHELWVFNEDAKNNPAVFVCTTVPDDFPIGKEIAEMVEVTGFFFKMYGYQAEDNMRRVPLLLGRTIKWSPAESPSAKTDWRWIASITVLFCLILFTLWRTRRRDKAYQAKRAKKEMPEEIDFKNLEEGMK